MEKFSDLAGRTIVGIAGSVGDEAMVIMTSDGRAVRMYHDQDRCEHVAIEDICGDLTDLIGVPVLSAEETSNSDEPGDPDTQDSYTWTYYKIATIKGRVTIRWYGSSNGYYSERVTFEEITKPKKLDV